MYRLKQDVKLCFYCKTVTDEAVRICINNKFLFFHEYCVEKFYEKLDNLLIKY